MSRFLSVFCLVAALASPACAGPVANTSLNASINPIAHEPFYAGILTQAATLKARTDALAATPSLKLRDEAVFPAYVSAIRDLSASDLKGHDDLKARGTDSDLKCILKGVSLDLGLKADALQAAKSDAEIAATLNDLSLLLSDNIDVISTPATADSGLDCVIEFGKGA